MTTTQLTLTEFLLARIAEDKAAAESARRFVLASGAQESPTSCRTLADCRAKERIVERLTFIENVGPPVDHTRALDMQIGGTAALRDAVSFLAAVYADHEDYRDEWQA